MDPGEYGGRPLRPRECDRDRDLDLELDRDRDLDRMLDAGDGSRDAIVREGRVGEPYDVCLFCLCSVYRIFVHATIDLYFFRKVVEELNG